MKSIRKIGFAFAAVVMSVGIVGAIEGPGHADTGWYSVIAPSR
jgi:hypothetical protein